MISLIKVIDESLESKLAEYEKALNILSDQPYYIDKIPDYTFYLARLLRSIVCNTQENYSELTARINFNNSFEDQLLTHGFYIDSIPDNLNLKKILLDISCTIHTKNKKFESILSFIQSIFNFSNDVQSHKILLSHNQNINKFLIICNNYDEDYWNEFIKKNRLANVELIRYKKFIKRKEEDLKNYIIICYFLEGFRDFEIYHNLNVTVNLFLYEFEESLYKYCINKYKSNLEKELQSSDRFSITEIKYEIPPPIPLTISQVLQNIIERTKDWSDKDYDNNIEDPDLSSSDYTYYCIHYEGTDHFDYLKSTESVFDENNNLIKVFSLKVGDKIRVYKLDFGEILLNTALEFQTEVFKEIENHSQLWKNVLRDIYYKIYKGNINYLHKDLKKHGVNVLESTVLNNWIFGKTKFPQSDKAIKAIYEISRDMTLGLSYNAILKSKRIYNSTMISLGRDLKDEIKNFLTNGLLGEILTKNNINPETLKKAIDEKMPLRKIENITVFLSKAEELDEQST